jgi:hypothetical protein
MTEPRQIESRAGIPWDYFDGEFTAARGRQMVQRAEMWLARWAIEAKFRGDMETYTEILEAAVELAWLRCAGRRAPLLHGLGDKR